MYTMARNLMVVTIVLMCAFPAKADQKPLLSEKDMERRLNFIEQRLLLAVWLERVFRCQCSRPGLRGH